MVINEHRKMYCEIMPEKKRKYPDYCAKSLVSKKLYNYDMGLITLWFSID